MKLTAIRQDVLSTIDSKTISIIKESLKERFRDFYESFIVESIGEKLWDEIKSVLFMFRDNGNLKKRFIVPLVEPSLELREIFHKLYKKLYKFINEE